MKGLIKNYSLVYGQGFIDIEQLSPPNKKGMGRQRAIAYSGTRKNPIDILGFKDYRTGGGGKKAIKFLETLISKQEEE